MKKDILRNYCLEILLIVILSLALFVSNIFSRKLLALVLTIFSIVCVIIVKKRNLKPTYERQVMIILSIFGIIYLLIHYLLGLYFGYYESPTKFSFKVLLNFIIPLILIIISSEVIRNKFIKQSGKFNSALLFIAMVLIDLIVYSGVYDLSNLEDFLAVIGFVFFASVACNLLYNYIAKRYGVKGIILFRLLTALYGYFIPIIPDIYIFFQSFIRMVFPYIIYLVLEHTYSKENYSSLYTDKKKNIISVTIVLITMTLLIALISCNFKYGLLVVGSGSMSNAILKGDVVFFSSYEGEELNVGDVIIFNQNEIETVHRIVDIEKVNGIVRYYTKGDANNDVDTGYSTSENIVGVVKFKIKYIGYPTIWLKDIFDSD